MPAISLQFPIRTPASRVFQAISTPEGLNAWWTLTSSGSPAVGNTYQLGFGPEYQWRAAVSRCRTDEELEWTINESDADWLGTRVGFTLAEGNGQTVIRFDHSGWREENAHFRISSYCWAMYLRLLKRYTESGEVVAYANRLDA